MSTPTDEYSNPFADPRNASVSSLQSPDISGSMGTSGGSGTPTAPGDKPKGKKKVGFGGTTAGAPTRSPGGTSIDGTYSPGSVSPGLVSPELAPTQVHVRQSSGDLLLPPSASKSHLPELSQTQTEQLRDSLSWSLDVPKAPRPALRRGESITTTRPEDVIEGPDDDSRAQRQASAREAFERGKRLERDEVLSYSAPASRRSSPTEHVRLPGLRKGSDTPIKDFDEKSEASEEADQVPMFQRQRKASRLEAFNLVRKHISERDGLSSRSSSISIDTNVGTRSGPATPTEEQRAFMEDYTPKPKQYRGGILGNLLRLYHDEPHPHSGGPTMPKAHVRSASSGGSALSSPAHSPPGSGTSTPTSPWSKNPSTSSLATLIGTSSTFGSPSAATSLGEQVRQRLQEQQAAKRPSLAGKRRHSGARVALQRMSRPRLHEEFRITEHIAETMTRQKYLLRLCKALMQYGAPTHRLEEYMMMSARVLETDAQFLYIPGAMIVSFEDRTTHTSEVKLVRQAQGLDLGKLRDVHEIYKDVVHDRLGAEEGIERLREVTGRDPKHNRLVRLPVYGLAAVCVGPFAFGARLIDLPISFILGCILGWLQLYVAPASDLYANVFEIAASVITSFLARAFGSINNGQLFCFSALAQSSIALILPGYIVLCASLELQSRQLVAGSVRMVYAIIYSLFLGFGITVGTAMYGLIDKNATSATECTDPISHYWFFFFVPGFAFCLIVINQAKWKQAPVMLFIAFAGYVVNYFSARRFAGNTQISNTLGALVIGVLANLYSRVGGKLENRMWDLWEERLRPRWRGLRRRIFHHRRQASPKSLEEAVSDSASSVFQPATRRVGYGLAAAAMLPAIFVQVPSGLAVNGSLVAGIASADQIVGNGTNGTTVVNSTTIMTAADSLNSVAFTVGYSVIQVAIGITVGLFLSAIVVYPFGKRRSGLFSF